MYKGPCHDRYPKHWHTTWLNLFILQRSIRLHHYMILA